jgi:hypothetical protein
VLHKETCTITVAFSPSAPGPHPADLRIYFASGMQPKDIPITGTGAVITTAITLAPAVLPAAQAGTPYTQQITAAGGTAPYTFSVTTGTLPPGLSLDTSGAISGTAKIPGSYRFTVAATDSSTKTRAGAHTYTLRVRQAKGAIILSPANLPDAQAGTPYTQQITGAGGTAPYTFSVPPGTLPPGMSLNPSTGVISGTAKTPGSYPFTITATDSSANSKTGSHAYTLRVIQAQGAITLSPANLPDAQAGTPYTQQITAAGGTAPYTFSVTTGTLPPGMSLNPSTGTISGGAKAPGSYPFTITATDSSANGKTGSHAYTLQVTPFPVVLTISPPSLPGGDCNAPYQETITAAGGTAPYSFALTTGTLPAGLSLDTSGVISGVIGNVTGDYSFAVTATDSSQTPNTGPQNYTISVFCLH